MLTEVTLHNDRRIWAQKVFIQETYADFQLRSPGRGNEWVLEMVPLIANRVFGEYPWLVVEPDTTSADLPELAIFGLFESTPVDPERMLSGLVLVWFQDGLSPLMSPAVFEKIRALDWESHAERYDI